MSNVLFLGCLYTCYFLAETIHFCIHESPDSVYVMRVSESVFHASFKFTLWIFDMDVFCGIE